MPVRLVCIIIVCYESCIQPLSTYIDALGGIPIDALPDNGRKTSEQLHSRRSDQPHDYGEATSTP